MKFCDFPLCDHSSVDCRINTHHITPKSQAGNNHKSNLFDCCPNHHNQIYIPGETKGIHSKMIIGDKTKLVSGSIILIRRMTSTSGDALLYFDCVWEKNYLYFYTTKEIVETNIV
jgi:predicted restriction endonuclease